MGQATKSPWWMPWGQGPKKGAARLRKASVSCLASIAGDSRIGEPVLVLSQDELSKGSWVSRGTETSKYPEEKKSTEIPLVVASERG